MEVETGVRALCWVDPESKGDSRGEKAHTALTSCDIASLGFDISFS